MAGPAPIKKRLPASERKEAIVDAAVDLFSQHGFQGVTTKQLAMAVGVSEPVLYQHFDTKRALYHAIIEAASAGQSADPVAEITALSEGDDSRAFFTRLADELLDWYLRDPRYARLLLFSNLEGHELADLFYEQRVAVFYEWVTRHIERQIAAGRMRSMDPLLAARAFAGMVVHQGMIYAIYHCGDLPATPREIVRTIVDLFLRGIESEPGGSA